MPLSVGDKLGHYEILSSLGKGGMGEVYRARDSRLKRDVAIKVLPEAFARDPERMARFQREAEVLASLNHPYIATIHGVEDRALVMELVEGHPPQGPLPFEEAWKIASQIAAALEYAHERGIVHRDLKPANILIGSDGAVKLLDFGLAKAFSNQREPSASPENSPTLTLGATEVGVILGTAAYMAPEQARGKGVDKRADIWSFGVVLYELLTGERLFTGEDAAETLAAVIHKQPDLAKVPREARRLLEECLRKDPRQRLRDIGDAKRLLGEGAAASTPASRPARLPWIAAGSMAAVAAALAIALLAPWRAENPVDRPLVRLDVDLGADVSLPEPSSGESSVAISPDGTRLVYPSGTPPRLFIRRLDQPKAIELPGTRGAVTGPIFSPDGLWVGFWAGNRMNKISVEGGAVVPLSDGVRFAGASWGEDGDIVMSEYLGRGLLRIPAGGGPPEAVAGLDSGEIALSNPRFLPGGKAILFAGATGTDLRTIEVLTLADRHRRIVARNGGSSPRYLAPSISGPGGVGHLVYVNQTTLFAIPFDLAKLETRGTAVPILDDVAYQPNNGTGQFDVSPAPSGHGTLVYRRGPNPAFIVIQAFHPTASG
jgi:serine/threonine protein kinase